MAPTTTTITPKLVHNALRIVFGEDSPYSQRLSALSSLSQSEVAAWFRRRALDLHPDRAGTLGIPPDRLEKAFKRLHGAYRLLSRLVEDEALRNRVIEADRPAAVRRTSGLWTPREPEPRERHRHDAAAARSDLRRTHAEESDARRYYRGRVPQSELRFAQFLYYNRVIDWKTMIDALTWQHRVRPKVGEIGRSYKFLDFEAVSRILRVSPRGELFGSTAMKLGVLDRRQLYVMLGKQHQLNYPIGRYFLEEDILSKPEIEHLLAQHRRHNSAFRGR
ncbi:MAG: J domain-containing protein [Spirochaetota bacterium]